MTRGRLNLGVGRVIAPFRLEIYLELAVDRGVDYIQLTAGLCDGIERARPARRFVSLRFCS
jgi:hypothetical protein